VQLQCFHVYLRQVCSMCMFQMRRISWFMFCQSLGHIQGRCFWGGGKKGVKSLPNMIR
jgi:hypothetical protein